MSTRPSAWMRPGTDRGAMIAASSREPGKVQVTYFDGRGFSGDYTADDETEAEEHRLVMRFTEEISAEDFNRLVLSPRFQAGCEITWLINAVHTPEVEAKLRELAAVINA